MKFTIHYETFAGKSSMTVDAENPKSAEQRVRSHLNGCATPMTVLLKVKLAPADKRALRARQKAMA